MKNSEIKKQKKLSAIIACYLDAPAVPIMYERLKKVFNHLSVEYEIIFVNDFSPDNAREVLGKLAAIDQRVVVVNLSRSFGSQSAFSSGMKIATGDAVILLDGDLQDPPELIEEFYSRWMDGFDVVYGTRIKRQAPLTMQLAYTLFYRIFRSLSYVSIPLDAGDFSLLDRRVVDALNDLPENNRFIRGLRAWVGYKQVGVPYVRPARMFGQTTNNLFNNIGWAKRGIFSFSYVPLELITGLAFACFTLSIIAMVAQVICRLLYPHMVPTGFSTIIVLILFMGSIQLLSLSIIGSYLAHIYDETKRRPPYIVESILNCPTKDAFENHTGNDNAGINPNN